LRPIKGGGKRELLLPEEKKEGRDPSNRKKGGEKNDFLRSHEMRRKGEKKEEIWSRLMRGGESSFAARRRGKLKKGPAGIPPTAQGKGKEKGRQGPYGRPWGGGKRGADQVGEERKRGGRNI